MKLKEFDFWSFMLELSESGKFSLFSRSVCAHFERHFESIDTDGVYRVIIKLSDLEERSGKVELDSRVLKFYQTFSFEYFESLDEATKNKFLLDTLYQSLLKVCEIEGWPKENFKNAYDLVIQENFVNTYTIRKKTNRKKTLIAEVIGQHNNYAFDCFLKVTDKSGVEVFQKLLFTEEPEEFFFNPQVGFIQWVSSATLIYFKKDKEDKRNKIELERLEF